MPSSSQDGDRAALVRVDEYGPGLVHPQLVLDLAYDAPRLAFQIRPLQLAWCEAAWGGDFDVPDQGPSSPRLLSPPFQSLYAVSLSSDGLNTWFLVVGGVSPRRPLKSEVTGQLKFIAGRICAVIFHQDLSPPHRTFLGPEGGPERFAGWPVLKDIEGREDDDEVNRRISLRFMVARALRSVMDDNLAGDRAAMDHQVLCANREMGKQFADDGERPHWKAVLRAVKAWDGPSIARAALGLARVVEEQRHLGGARVLPVRSSNRGGGRKPGVGSRGGYGRCAGLPAWNAMERRARLVPLGVPAG